MTDDMLRAVAKNNGVVMVNFYPAFIDEHWRQAWNAQQPEREKAQDALEAKAKAKGQPVPYAASDKIDREFAAKIGRAPLNSLIDHFDHVTKIAGIDHVGIGTDFDGIPVPPEGIDSAADLPKITAALMARGYTADDMDENTRRQPAPRIRREYRLPQKSPEPTTESTTTCPREYRSCELSGSEKSSLAFAISALAISPLRCASRPASSLKVSNTLYFLHLPKTVPGDGAGLLLRHLCALLQKRPQPQLLSPASPSTVHKALISPFHSSSKHLDAQTPFAFLETSIKIPGGTYAPRQTFRPARCANRNRSRVRRNTGDGPIPEADERRRKRAR